MIVRSHLRLKKSFTSSVSPELLQGFARSLALVANWRNITLLSINMKANWRANFLKNCEQANQCNNSGETEEVVTFESCYYNDLFLYLLGFSRVLVSKYLLAEIIDCSRRIIQRSLIFGQKAMQEIDSVKFKRQLSILPSKLISVTTLEKPRK